MTEWIKFVKDVRNQYNCSYKEALVLASKLRNNNTIDGGKLFNKKASYISHIIYSNNFDKNKIKVDDSKISNFIKNDKYITKDYYGLKYREIKKYINSKRFSTQADVNLKRKLTNYVLNNNKHHNAGFKMTLNRDEANLIKKYLSTLYR